MARIKIDYGIDLGTTNSAICRMESGEPVIKKTDTLKDTMPSCVSFNKKKSSKIGDTAFNDLKSDKRRATKSWKQSASNTFIEFKRTMGQDTLYDSSYMEHSFSSEELSAEILKALKSYVTDEPIKAAIITVPAKFSINQKEATKRAAHLAGIEHCELLQEPIAAAMAYGLDSDQKNAYWLVFDFGGGTFDAALLKVEDGIIQVFDTEGDNYLGGKNLDYTVVDNIIIPYLKENYTIDEVLADTDKSSVLREAMKTYAEEAKIQLSFKDSEDIISNLGDLGEDDEGEEIELDLTLTSADLERVLTPIYQKAVTICKSLLERNNMQGDMLDSVILVGGPTFSPILRNMIKEQITTKVDTQIDPMTAVARGAALYASTIDNSVKAELEMGTVALEVAYESTSVETLEFVSIKLNSADSTGQIPTPIFVEFTRSDKSWSSGKLEINEIGDVVECQLIEGKSNCFNIVTYDNRGTVLPCFPNEITIIQGSKVGSAILPYNIGLEIWNTDKKKALFSSIKGLERNQSLPAIGVANGLKTPKDLRPGISSDFIKIPIYQGDEGADGVKAIYFEHVHDAIITGDMVPRLLPVGSDVDITIKVDRSEGVQMEVFFPTLNHTEEIVFDKDKVQTEVSEQYIKDEIDKAQFDLNKLQSEGENIDDMQTKLVSVSNELANGDQRKQVLQHLKEVLRDVDKLDSDGEWARLDTMLREEFKDLEQANNELGNEKSTQMVKALRTQVDEVIRAKDIAQGKRLLDDIKALFVHLTMIYQLINFVRHHNENFNSFAWANTSRARMLLNSAQQMISDNPNVDKLHPIVVELINLLPKNQIPDGAGGLLVN